MKKIFYFISVFVIIISCTKDDNLLLPTELDKPSAMNVFCQNSSNKTLSRIEYKYENDLLISETTTYNGNIQNKISYEYNSNNQLVFEIYETSLQKTEKTFIYNQLNQLINIKYKFINYDNNGQVLNERESEAPKEYKNNLVVKEWENWGGFNTYDYKNGKVITKIEHTKAGIKHHITTYYYSENLLIKEKKETKEGTLMYLKTYKYDSQNRIIKIKDGENTIEENDYLDKKLLEKRTYYFGIDPGHYTCNGNYIYRYEY
jgi:uncharacterized protein YcfL